MIVAILIAEEELMDDHCSTYEQRIVGVYAHMARAAQLAVKLNDLTTFKLPVTIAKTSKGKPRVSAVKQFRKLQIDKIKVEDPEYCERPTEYIVVQHEVVQ